MPVYRIYTAASPFNAADLGALNFAQVADVIYFAHQNYAPGKLIRYGHTNWQWVNVTFGPTITAPTGVGGTATTPNTDAANSGNAYFPEPATYVVTAIDNATGQESRASTGVTLTNDVTLKRNYNTITWTAKTWSTSQGGYYRVYKAQNSNFPGYIGATTSTSFVDDNIDPDTSQGPPTGYNPFPGAGDYPGLIKFHEQRSWWGNTINHPNALYASRSADYENMDYRQPGQADDSLAIGLVTDKVNVVNQLASTKQGLLALTSNCVFSIKGSNDDYIAATPPPKATVELTRGVSPLQPIIVDAAVLYQTMKTGQVRALGYEFEIDGLRTDDVSIFARHLFDNHSIVDWCWVEKPHSAILAVRDDGIMLVLTWDQAQQVWGWTTWSTAGSYLGVCSITEEGEDRVYALVQRTIEGVSQTYVERFASELWTDAADACYLDCAKTYFNTDTTITTFDRLDHLNGCTVMAWVDGALYSADAYGNPLVVVNGSLTLPAGGATVTIGLPFTSEIETLPLAMQTATGWTVARPQDAGHTVVKVINTAHIQVGPSEDNLFEVKQRQYEDFGNPTDLFTGNLDVDMAGIVGDEVTVYVKSDVPAPMEIVGILVEPNVGSVS
jgi:hypothetical protein